MASDTPDIAATSEMELIQQANKLLQADADWTARVESGEVDFSPEKVRQIQADYAAWSERATAFRGAGPCLTMAINHIDKLLETPAEKIIESVANADRGPLVEVPDAITTPAATLAELDRLHEAATPAPWRASDDAPDDVVLWAAREDGDKRFLANVGGDNPSEVGVAFDIDTHNANLIASLRNAYPLLRAHIATLEERNRTHVVELLKHAAANATLAGQLAEAGRLLAQHHKAQDDADEHGDGYTNSSLHAATGYILSTIANGVGKSNPWHEIATLTERLAEAEKKQRLLAQEASHWARRAVDAENGLALASPAKEEKK